MVSRREAHAAYRDPVAGLGVRRHPRGAGAELGDRASLLALRLRRARRGWPDVGRGLAGARQGGTLDADGCDGGGRTAHPLFPVADLADLHRLLRRDVRRLLGIIAWAHLV